MAGHGKCSICLRVPAGGPVEGDGDCSHSGKGLPETSYEGIPWAITRHDCQFSGLLGGFHGGFSWLLRAETAKLNLEADGR